MEARIERVLAAVAGGWKDGECVIARKVAPDRAAVVAEKLAALRLSLKKMEDQLRAAAVTGTLALQRGRVGGKHEQAEDRDQQLVHRAAVGDFCRIGISRGVPRRPERLPHVPASCSPVLARSSCPTASSPSATIAEVLERLDPHQTVDELMELAAGKIPALLCFEHAHSPAWCHRGMVSAWLHLTLGLDVLEYGREQDGCGATHPKLCDSARDFYSRC